MQFHTAKLFLYQVAFFERSLQHNPALHLNTLCEGLESAKSFLDLYLWLPPKSEMALTNSEWIQLSFGVTLAAKFAIVSKGPDVELQTRDLRHRLNIDNVFRHLSLRIGALVGRAGDEKKEKDIFYHYELRVRKIQNWFERMVKATGSDSPLNQQANISQVTVPTQRLPQAHTHPAPPSQPSQVPPPPQTQPPQQYHPTTTAGYTPQQPMSYPNGQLPSNAVANVGMTSMSPSPYTTGYSPVPTIAFPDLMNAPGWELPFTIPMDDNTWMFDPSAGYQGMNMASPPSESNWESPVNL